MGISKEDFVHLHVHSDFSLIDGVATVKSLVDKALKSKHRALALTDHGNICGALTLWKTASAKGIKPIVGLEAYIVDGNHQEKIRTYNHLTLLAQNEAGYKNLSKLSSLGYTEGFYYKPRINWELLEAHSDGVICLSGCLKGPISVPIVQDKKAEAFKIAGRMHDIFRDRLFLEIQSSPLEEQYLVNDACMRLSVKMGIPLVATCDVHYVNPEDADIQDLKICIANGKKLSDKERWRIKEGLYYRSTEEMKILFSHVQEAITNTCLVADMVDFKFQTVDTTNKYYLPKFKCPGGIDEQDYFMKLSEEGLRKRYKEVSDIHIDRLNFEAKVIVNSGYISYFLIVQDFINWAKNNDIPVGPGRGCLTDKSFVFTDKGYKSIKDIIVGEDKTINEHGVLSDISHKFEYDVDEEIFTIKCYYDFWSSSQFTADHEILVKKGKPPSIYGKTLFPSDSENYWAASRDIAAGDYVCIPKFNKFKEDDGIFEKIDLGKYRDALHECCDSIIIEKTPISHSYKGSIRDVSKASGISRNCLKAIVEKNSSVKASSRERLLTHLTEGDIAQDIEKWVEYVESQKNKTSNLPRFLLQDEDYAKFIGLWIGDGNYIGSTGVAISLGSNDSEAIEFLDEYLENVLHVRFSKVHPIGKPNLVAYSIYSRIINRHIKEVFGVVYSDTKFIPEFFMKNKALAKALLVGLIWADGSSKERRVQYDTVSERLMYDVRRLGYYLNTPSTVSKREYNGKGQERWKDSYKIRFARSQAIQDLFGIPSQEQNFYFEDDDYMYCAVMKVEAQQFKGKVYDLTISGDSPSFLTGGYIVHNSASGSIIAYSLGITDIDPIEYDLLFERFLNPDRVSMPDIDIDFCEEKRGLVIDYVREKYGDDNVCQIVTFGRLKAKAAIRDVCRVMDLPAQDATRITAMVRKDDDMKSFRRTDFAKKIEADNPEMTKIFDYAQRLEGVSRDLGKHAAGVVIGDTNLLERIPLATVGSKGAPRVKTTQFGMAEVEEVGLLKMDFLGLRTLTVIHEAERLISKKLGRPFITKEEVDLNDQKTYKEIIKGNTKGMFQIESRGFQKLLSEMEPDNINDIIASLALFRPGPLGAEMDKHYVARKHGREEVEYLHPCLEPILKTTYGGILYQEQVMKIANECAGFTMAEADTLRKAMGKKKIEIMDKMKTLFIEGLNRVSGVYEDAAKEIWDQIVYFASYGFNLSHSAAYGILSFNTAYLKTNYPIEYMTALLTSFWNKNDKIAFYSDECRRMGLKILPPNIQKSDLGFTVEDGAIRYGLRAIKSIGIEVAEDILSARRRAKVFKSIYHFAEHLQKSSTKVLETLVKCGALDHLGHRAQLVSALEEAVKGAKKGKKGRKNKGKVQGDLFAGFDDEIIEEVDAKRLPNVPEWTKKELQEYEREIYGFYLTSHPLDDCVEIFGDLDTHTTVQVSEMEDGDYCSVGGMVTSLRVFNDRRGNAMAKGTLTDHLSSINFVVFSSNYDKIASLIKEEAKVVLEGIYGIQEGFAPSVNVNTAMTVDDAQRMLKKKTAKKETYSEIKPYVQKNEQVHASQPRFEEPPEPEPPYDYGYEDYGYYEDPKFERAPTPPRKREEAPRKYRKTERDKEGTIPKKSSFDDLAGKLEGLKPNRIVEIEFSILATDGKILDDLKTIFDKHPGQDIVHYRFTEYPDDIYEMVEKVKAGKAFGEDVKNLIGDIAILKSRTPEEATKFAKY